MVFGVVAADAGAAVSGRGAHVVGTVHPFGSVTAAVAGGGRRVVVAAGRCRLVPAAVVGPFEGTGGADVVETFGHRGPPAGLGPVRPVVGEGGDVVLGGAPPVVRAMVGPVAVVAVVAVP